MSLMKCHDCERIVDTDTDAEPESFVQVSDMRRTEEYICLCEWCRNECPKCGEPAASLCVPCGKWINP